MLIFTKGTLAEIRAICIHLDKIWFNHIDKRTFDRNEANMLRRKCTNNEQTSMKN